MKSFKAILFLAMAAVILSAAVCPAAFAAGSDAEVEGLWLRVPDFPDDAEVMEFEDDGEGRVDYTRAIDGSVLILSIHRERADDKTTPKKIKKMIENNVVEKGGDKDDIDFDDAAEDFSEMLSYPCVTAEYEIGENEDARRVANVCVFTDEYVFILQLAVTADAFEDYQSRSEKWLKSIKLVDGAPSEEEGRGDVFGDEEGGGSSAPDSEVSGLWLRIPDFPDDAEVVEFKADDDGEVTYIRSLGGGVFVLGILRLPAGEEATTEKMKESIAESVTESGGDAEEIDFDDEAEGFSEMLSYPCMSAEYEIGEDGDAKRYAVVGVFTDEYVFLVQMAVAEGSLDDYSGRTEGWFKSMKLVD
jgi:lipocalin